MSKYFKQIYDQENSNYYEFIGDICSKTLFGVDKICEVYFDHSQKNITKKYRLKID